MKSKDKIKVRKDLFDIKEGDLVIFDTIHSWQDNKETEILIGLVHTIFGQSNEAYVECLSIKKGYYATFSLDRLKKYILKPTTKDLTSTL
uniref:Uncharacterized protein n=1 Tax=viral metagenome TaxID=1070528 RepID=A0A6H1ZSA0_9ZZZZ